MIMIVTTTGLVSKATGCGQVESQQQLLAKLVITVTGRVQKVIILMLCMHIKRSQ